MDTNARVRLYTSERPTCIDVDGESTLLPHPRGPTLQVLQSHFITQYIPHKEQFSLVEGSGPGSELTLLHGSLRGDGTSRATRAQGVATSRSRRGARSPDQPRRSASLWSSSTRALRSQNFTVFTSLDLSVALTYGVKCCHVCF